MAAPGDSVGWHLAALRALKPHHGKTILRPD